MFSVPVFLISFIVNRQGRHGLAFSLAFIELLFHQVAAVYFIGWDSGLQYFLIYLAGLTLWYGVYKKSTRELTYASGGHPPALFFENANSDDSNATLLRTPNSVIGGVPDATYEKRKHFVGERTTLYIFSDGVYKVSLFLRSI
jgi:hypothetical protein